MRLLTSILAFSLAFFSSSCHHKLENINPPEENINNSKNEKYLNFIAALKNGSTFSYFTVIEAKNLNTGETKEICTKGEFVLGALITEFESISYDEISEEVGFDIEKLNTDRYFEFKSKKALDNISFFEYNTNLTSEIQKKYDFDKTIETIRKTKKFSIRLSNDEMKAFAHVLFNKGYMTGEHSCWGGELEYVDPSRVEKQLYHQ